MRLPLLSAALAVGSLACAGPPVAPPPPPPRQLTTVPHPMPADCTVGRDAVAIHCGRRSFAAFLCFAPEGRTCRALAIRYGDGLAWLYRPEGFDPAHPERFQPVDEWDTQRAFTPSVAWDGRLVWFGARGPKGRGHVHEYDVQSGELRTLERSDEWKVWSDESAQRALPITRPAAPLPEDQAGAPAGAARP